MRLNKSLRELTPAMIEYCQIFFLALIVLWSLLIYSFVYTGLFAKESFIATEIVFDVGQIQNAVLNIKEQLRTSMKKYALSAIVCIAFIQRIYTSKRTPATDKKQIKREAAQDYAELSIDVDVPDINLPLKKVISGNFCEEIKDCAIKQATVRICLIAILIVFSMLIMYPIQGEESAKMQTEFMCTEYDGVEYVILYTNGENAILSTCYIFENILTINKFAHKIVSLQGLSYEIREFEIIEYVENAS